MMTWMVEHTENENLRARWFEYNARREFMTTSVFNEHLVVFKRAVKFVEHVSTKRCVLQKKWILVISL